MEEKKHRSGSSNKHVCQIQRTEEAHFQLCWSLPHIFNLKNKLIRGMGQAVNVVDGIIEINFLKHTFI